MTVLIEDSPRNLLAWVLAAIDAGSADGAVISPFATPSVGKNHRRSASAMAQEITTHGGQLFFDATTHALQAPGVGDFRYYDEYDLWGGTRGDISSPASRAEHVRLVLEQQLSLGATALGPTRLLTSASGPASAQALDLSERTMALNPDSWLSIAGDSSFWASGGTLDAHVGGLAQLEPEGWFLTVGRPTGVLPASAQRAEIAGVCRTVRALSEYAPVHISHGDIAALPAVAAGASSTGSGWDQRQRVFSYVHYNARVQGGEGGGWYTRLLATGLLSLFKRPELMVLQNRDAVVSDRLIPGPVPPDVTKDVFLRHIEQLNTLVQGILGLADPEDRYLRLKEMYENAYLDWPEVASHVHPELSADDWLAEVSAGLDLYGIDEGW